MIRARGISLPAKRGKKNTVQLFLACLTLKGMSVLTQLQMEYALCLVYLQTHTYAHAHTDQMEFSIKTYITDNESSFCKALADLFIIFKKILIKYWYQVDHASEQ